MSEDTEPTLIERMSRANLIRHRLQDEFEAIFGVKIADYWHVYTNFDCIKFSRHLQTPTDQSLKDFVTEKYGERAYEVVHQLTVAGYEDVLYPKAS